MRFLHKAPSDSADSSLNCIIMSSKCLTDFKTEKFDHLVINEHWRVVERSKISVILIG